MATCTMSLFFEMSDDDTERECGICNKALPDPENPNNSSECDMCMMKLCFDCTALVGPDGEYRRCVNCFDYKCRLCKAGLGKNQYYVEDPILDNLCEECSDLYSV